MFRHWRYAVVAMAAVLITSTTVTAAQPLKGFFIGSSDGQRSAEITVDGRLLVDAELPAVQNIQGNVNIGNLPAIQDVQGNLNVGNLPAIQAIQGTVDVGNLPAIQDIQGNVTVENFDLPDPQLFTLLDEVNVPAELPLAIPIVSDFVDVSGFSTFRVFTRTTSQSGSGTLIFKVTESVDGVVTESVDGVVASRKGATGGLGHTLFGFLPDVPPFDLGHGVASHPYRYLGVEVLSNNSGDAHTFSVFLHAAP